jgi:hypothetical protein
VDAPSHGAAAGTATPARARGARDARNHVAPGRGRGHRRVHAARRLPPGSAAASASSVCPRARSWP